MGYVYKQLTTSDIKFLHELLEVFGEAFNDQNTYQNAVPSDTHLAALLGKDNFIALVALDDSKVVGGLTAYELEKPEQDRSEIYIYDLAVLEAHRRKGIARGLISELKKIAKDRGVYIIFVQADPGDNPAIKLYESLGKREEVYHFDIPVNGE